MVVLSARVYFYSTYSIQQKSTVTMVINKYFKFGLQSTMPFGPEYSIFNPLIALSVCAITIASYDN